MPRFSAHGYTFLTPSESNCSKDNLDILSTYEHILNNWEVLRNDPVLMNSCLNILDKQKYLYEILKANVHAALRIANDNSL